MTIKQMKDAIDAAYDLGANDDYLLTSVECDGVDRDTYWVGTLEGAYAYTGLRIVSPSDPSYNPE